MYKVLFATGSLSQGGTEMFMMNILRQIDRTRFHIDFCICSNEITPNRIEAESYGCKVYVLPSRHLGLLKYIKALWTFMKEHAGEYDAVHWNGGNVSSFMSFITYKYYGIPVRVVHAHSSNAVGLHNKILHGFHRNFLSIFCTHFFACSSDSAKFFYKESPTVIINNGIDVEKYDYDVIERKVLRDEYQISDDAIVLGHVGRFDDNKNHSFLLEVFKEYNVRHSNSYLLLIGQGVTFAEIENKVKVLGLSDKVILTGPRNDVHRFMSAMDCFVMPSKFEGLPFVLVEAQCSGLPCIVSDTINIDAKLTENITFTSLKYSPKHWCSLIENKMSSFFRESQSDTIIAKGFSIKDSVQYLQKVYSGEL